MGTSPPENSGGDCSFLPSGQVHRHGHTCAFDEGIDQGSENHFAAAV